LSYKINYSDETQFDGPTQVQTQYTYDDNDRLTKQGGVEYEYDKNGNTTRIAEEDQVMLLHYDGNDRLIKVTTEENGQVTSTVTYAYDADGNRIQTNADGEVTQYVVDSNDSLAQVIAELDANNQVNVAYLHGDDLISQYRGNEVNYYHYDGLGSTRTLTNPNSEVTDSYTYEAFGELQEQTGNTENNYLYTGEQLDPNTGDYYLRARFYHPGSGRFLSMDSFDGNAQDPITLHKYLYANGNPVNMVDPSGYFSIGSFSAANNIRGILTNIQIDVGLSFMDAITTNPNDMSASALGGMVLFQLAGPLAPQLMRLFSKKARVCSRNSFTADTLVHTQQGLITIAEVQIGDFVWSFNEETDKSQWNEVTHLIQGDQEYNLVVLTLENGETIEATEEHPFSVVGKGWVAAEALTQGDVLVTKDGNIKISSVEREQRTVVVYNLTVENAHTFYIGQDGVLVHNVNYNPSVDYCQTKRGSVWKIFKPRSGSPIYRGAPQRLPTIGEAGNMYGKPGSKKAAGILEFGNIHMDIISSTSGPGRGWLRGSDPATVVYEEFMTDLYNDQYDLAYHVEGHIAAILHMKGVKGRGKLYLNMPPCGLDWNGNIYKHHPDQNHFCNESLEYMLPKGVTLEVIWGGKSHQRKEYSGRWDY
jgi:RHS repeat-associated protein